MRFFWAEKILPPFFRLREIHKKQKNSKKPKSLAPTPTNRVYDRNFPYAWIPHILNNNSPQFRSNRRQKFFSKKPRTPPFYRICTPKNHLKDHSSLIKHTITMNSTPLDSSFQCASFERKNFTSLFSFKRNSQKTKKLKKTQIFGPHTNKSGYDRNFPNAWIPLILNNNSPQFRSNRRQNIFSKKPRTPPFYRICTPKKHLNGHSSLIKHTITMNSTPLDSSFQSASFEPKKFYLPFFV
jgi:hypothetical protein